MEMHHEIYKRHLKCVKVSYGVSGDAQQIVGKLFYDMQSLFLPNMFLNGMSHSLKRKTYEEITDDVHIRVALARNELNGFLVDLLPQVYIFEAKWISDLMAKTFNKVAISPRPIYSNDVYIMQTSPEVWCRTIFDNFLRDWVATLRRVVAMGEPNNVITDTIFNTNASIWRNLTNKINNLVRTSVIEKVNEARLNSYALNPQEFSYAQKTHPFSNTSSGSNSRGDNSITLTPISDVSGIFEDTPPVLKNFNSISTIVPMERLQDDGGQRTLGNGSKQLARIINEDARRWFSGQPENFQKKELGEKKYRLYKKDKITRTQLWNFTNSQMGIRSLLVS